MSHTHPCPTCETAVPCAGVFELNPGGRDFEPICLAAPALCARCAALEVTERRHWGSAGATREDMAAQLGERGAEIEALTAEITRLQRQLSEARLELQQLRSAQRDPATATTHRCRPRDTGEEVV